MALDSFAGTRKQGPKAEGQVVKATIVSAPVVGLGLWLGHGGVSLLLQTAGALAAINIAIGKKGGAFDRLVSVVEKVAARKAREIETRPDGPPPPRPATRRGKGRRT